MVTNNNKRVGIYVRVSTLEQAREGYSVGEQLQRLKTYVDARGWTLIDEYVDPGFSGANTNRPALQQLIADIKSKKINLVLVYKLDRLSRSQKDTLLLIEDVFLKNDCDFLSMNENFDTSTPFGKAMIGILSVFAQLEREQIKERTMLGAAARAKEGLYHGGKVAIGYDLVDSKLVINEYEAMQLREAADMFLNGDSMCHIAEVMNAKGYKTKYGIWRNSVVLSAVSNPLYAGYMRHRDTVLEGQHEAIYNKETWERLQARYKEYYDKTEPFRKRAARGSALLSGLVWCGDCGARYFCKVTSSGHNKNLKYKNYYCYSRAHTNLKMVKKKGCKNKGYRVEKLDQLIIDEIKKLRFDDVLNEVMTPALVQDSTPVKKKRIKEIDTQLSRLMDLYQMGGIDYESLGERVKQLNTERQTLQQDIEAMVVPAGPSKEEVKAKIKNADDVFASGSFEEQQEFIRSLIDKVVINGSDIEIHWSFV